MSNSGGNGGGRVVRPNNTQPQQFRPMQQYQPMQQNAQQPVQQNTPAARQSTQPNIFQQSSTAYNNAVQGPNIDRFQNQYTQDVTNRTLADMNRSRQMTMNDIGARASSAGAFGGDRQALLEAENNRNFYEQSGNVAANLNMQGYNNSLNAAQQDQQMNAQLSQQGFNMGSSINQQQAQQGEQQRQINQQVIDANKQQYSNWANSPYQSQQLYQDAMQGSDFGQRTNTQTTSRKNGLFDYISTGSSFFGGMR